MTDWYRRPFSRAEMEAMRRAERDERGVLTEAWGMLTRLATKLPFAEDLAAAFYCARDPQTPARVRLTLLGALAYVVLPTDALADFLPLVGFADDAAVVATVIATVAGAIKPIHRDQARETLRSIAETGRPPASDRGPPFERMADDEA